MPPAASPATGKRANLGGVCAAVLTPLSAQLRPDHTAAGALYRALLSEGCDALNILGTTGEANSIAVHERRAFMEGVAAAGLPMDRLMIGTGSCALDEAVELTRAALALGYAGTLILPPFYYKNVSEDGVFAYFSAILDRAGDCAGRIYLYHFPQMSGVPFTLELIARLIAAYGDCIAGLKDSSGDLAYTRAVAQRFPALDVFPSSEAALLEGRAQGFAGCISATVAIAAALAARVWQGVDSAAADQAELTRIRETIAKRPLIPAVRHLSAKLRGDASLARMLPPMAPLAPDVAAQLERDLAGGWLGARLRP